MLKKKMASWGYSVVLVISLICTALATISEDKQSSIYVDCLREVGQTLTKYPEMRASDEELEWSCMQSYLWRTAAEREAPRKLSGQQVDFLETLIGRPGSNEAWKLGSSKTLSESHLRLKRSLANVPRKEYRALTDAERTAFHNALNSAKASTLLSPNVYDFLASLHSGVLASGAHGGPAFLPFHRIYLMLMDLVIAFFDTTNTVRLAFWDNTLDNELSNPTLSIMWDSNFAGQGNGLVSNGPFGSWSTLNGPSIIRNIGSGGSLMSKANVDAVLTQSSLTDISKPTAPPQYDLERYHGLVHVWVGGDMSALNTATNDPVFFMHHAYIDCVWQQFRDLQPGKGVNPNTDYPNTLQTYHRPTDSVGIVASITNAQAVTALYASFSRCEHPQCPKCGPYLRCINNRCVPVLSEEADPCPSCPGSNPGGYTGYQNSYCINGYCDTSQWAYVPVQITYSRPPDYDIEGQYGYRSYPVREGRAVTKYDVYSPQAYTETGIYTDRYSRQDRSSRYTDCGCRQGNGNSGTVYVQSNGINYDGSYREYSVVDRRYAISSSIAYVAVRNPREQITRAYVNVYDECGRLCRPTCRINGRWVPCSGAVSVTNYGGGRRGYGDTYEQATYQVWNFEDKENPSYSQDNIYLNYMCDYTGAWPEYRTRGK